MNYFVLSVRRRWSQPFLFAEDSNSDTSWCLNLHMYLHNILSSCWAFLEKLHSGLDLDHLNEGKSLVGQGCRRERFAVRGGGGTVINHVILLLQSGKENGRCGKWLLTCTPLPASRQVCEVEGPGRPGSTPCGGAFLCSVDTMQGWKWRSFIQLKFVTSRVQCKKEIPPPPRPPEKTPSPPDLWCSDPSLEWRCASSAAAFAARKPRGKQIIHTHYQSTFTLQHLRFHLCHIPARSYGGPSSVGSSACHPSGGSFASAWRPLSPAQHTWMKCMQFIIDDNNYKEFAYSLPHTFRWNGW